MELAASFPFPFILLDGQGFVRAVRHPANGHAISAGWLRIGTNHLENCETSDQEPVRQLGSAIRKVLEDPREVVKLPCPWTSATETEECQVVLSAARESGAGGVLLVHMSVPTTHLTAISGGDPQSQKLETIGRLTSGVAHDFANLLTLISGYSELLLNRISDRDPLRSELEEIRRAANRGAGMTARLLDFVRSQAVVLKSLDINALITDLERMLRPIIGEHIQLSTSLATDLGKVKADQEQIMRVLMNLVLNARDAMPKGGKMAISTANLELGPEEAMEPDLEPGAYVSVSLTDTGAGMDAEVMSHMFEPFFTTKQKGKGTGLGLSTVYGIVKESRGGIRVTSSPGQGTTFTVLLPRIEELRETSESKPAANSTGTGTETILLVEDEDCVRRLVKYVLNARGYNVLEAEDGVQALEVYRQCSKPIHMLLTDMLMPRMNGGDLAQRIQELQPDIKVVCMSGYTGMILAQAGPIRQGVTFLEKPLKPEVLISKVREVLDTPTPSNPPASLP